MRRADEKWAQHKEKEGYDGTADGRDLVQMVTKGLSQKIVKAGWRIKDGTHLGLAEFTTR